MMSFFPSETDVFHKKFETLESKKAIRNVVKRAIKQHDQQKISDGELKSLLEFAMMFEISTGLDNTMSSFEENMNKKLR